MANGMSKWRATRIGEALTGFGAGGQLVVSSILLAGFLAVIWALREPAELRQRRRELEAASSARRQEWLASWRELEGLSEKERAHLWGLYREFQSQRDGDDLLETLKAYQQWLALLPAPESTKIRAMPADERLKVIKEKLDKSALDRFLLLSEKSFAQEDHQVTCEWLNGLLESRKELLKEVFPHWNRVPQRVQPFMFYQAVRSSQQRVGERRGGSERSGSERGRSERGRRYRIDPELVKKLQVTDEEIDALAKQLSDGARSYLEQATSAKAKRELIAKWVRAVMVARFFRPTTEQLRAYMETLPESTRDRLERLPREKMMGELRRMFMRSQFRSPGEGGPRRPFGPPGPRGRPLPPAKAGGRLGVG